LVARRLAEYAKGPLTKGLEWPERDALLRDFGNPRHAFLCAQAQISNYARELALEARDAEVGQGRSQHGAASNTQIESHQLQRSVPEGATQPPDRAVPSEQVSGKALETEAKQKPPRRQPDIETSRKRLELVRTLSQELAKIKLRVKRHCTADSLKKEFPGSIVWEWLDDAQVKELAAGEAFSPKAYAENIVLAHYGCTNREMLNKDRKKLRKAGLQV